MRGLTLRLKVTASAWRAALRMPFELERYVDASACRKRNCSFASHDDTEDGQRSVCPTANRIWGKEREINKSRTKFKSRAK